MNRGKGRLKIWYQRDNLLLRKQPAFWSSRPPKNFNDTRVTSNPNYYIGRLTWAKWPAVNTGLLSVALNQKSKQNKIVPLGLTVVIRCFFKLVSWPRNLQLREQNRLRSSLIQSHNASPIVPTGPAAYYLAVNQHRNFEKSRWPTKISPYRNPLLSW